MLSLASLWWPEHCCLLQAALQQVKTTFWSQPYSPLNFLLKYKNTANDSTKTSSHCVGNFPLKTVYTEVFLCVKYGLIRLRWLELERVNWSVGMNRALCFVNKPLCYGVYHQRAYMCSCYRGTYPGTNRCCSHFAGQKRRKCLIHTYLCAPYLNPSLSLILKGLLSKWKTKILALALSCAENIDFICPNVEALTSEISE